MNMVKHVSLLLMVSLGISLQAMDDQAWSPPPTKAPTPDRGTNWSSTKRLLREGSATPAPSPAPAPECCPPAMPGSATRLQRLVAFVKHPLVSPLVFLVIQRYGNKVLEYVESRWSKPTSTLAWDLHQFDLIQKAHAKVKETESELEALRKKGKPAAGSADAKRETELSTQLRKQRDVYEKLRPSSSPSSGVMPGEQACCAH